MDDSEIVKLNHQRNKSEIVNLVKAMFAENKWGDEEFKVQLQELVVKDEKLVKDVIAKIKQEKSIQSENGTTDDEVLDAFNKIKSGEASRMGQKSL